MRKYIAIIAAILLTFSQELLSQNQYTLEDCIDSAIVNNVGLKNAAIEIEKAENTKKSAFTNYFPQVSATAGAFISNHSMIDVDASDIDITVSSTNAYVDDIIQTLINIYGDAIGFDANIQMTKDGLVGGAIALQPVFMGGRIYNGNKLANLGIEAAKYQYELAEKDIRVKAEKNFWLVISLKEKAKTIETVTCLLDTLYRDVSCACEAGLTMKNNLLKVKLKQNEMQSNKLKVDNGIRLSKMALCQFMGIVYNDSIEFVEPSRTVGLPPYDFDNSDEAVNRRTESKLLNLSVEAETLKRKMLLGETMPQFAVGAGYLYNNLMGKNNTNGILFGTLSIPISGWWSANYNLKKQDLNAQIAINNQTEMHQMMSLQMQQNINELTESYQQVTVAQIAIDEAKENLKLADDYYKAGLSTVSELLEAQTSLQQSLDQFNDAYIQYRIKLTEYQRNR